MKREEAIEDLLRHYTGESTDIAIKALKREPVLDQIRAEIEELPKTYPFVNHFDMYVKVSDVTRIIDKYKAESESE